LKQILPGFAGGVKEDFLLFPFIVFELADRQDIG
jgi:hypothetical protein